MLELLLYWYSMYVYKYRTSCALEGGVVFDHLTFFFTSTSF